LQGEIIKRFLDSIVIVTAPAGHPSANACLELAKEANDIFARTAISQQTKPKARAAVDYPKPRESHGPEFTRAARSMRRGLADRGQALHVQRFVIGAGALLG
jgi:hypothetical protein